MEYQLTLNWPDFLERHWQKRPVVLKRGFSNFIDPLSPDELAGLAMESEIDSRLVSHQDGKWQVSHGPFESYDHLGESNWSLLVQAVNHWHEPTAALMRPFRALPDWRIDDLMISFSVPGGGVGPHLDQYDVFIIREPVAVAGAWAKSCKCVSTARIPTCYKSIRSRPLLMKSWSRATFCIFRQDSRMKAMRWKTP